METMKSLSTHIRGTRLLVTAAFLAASGLSFLAPFNAQADQITQRYVKMSTSELNAANVTYELGFTTAKNDSIKGIVLSFCGDTPYLGTACAAMTNFSVTGATLVGTPVNLSGTWSVTTSNGSGSTGSSDHVIIATNSTGSGTFSGNTSVSIQFGGIHNPNIVTNGNSTSPTYGTFYARIVTFSTTAAATAYQDATYDSSNAAVIDQGGAALSTANAISITARVLETITFCVSSEDPIAGCKSSTAGQNLANNGIVLGDTSGPTTALDSRAVYVGKYYSQVSTNATNGVVIRLKNNTKCGGLTRFTTGITFSSGCDIPANGTSASTGPAILAPGTAGFGVAVLSGTALGTAQGTLTPSTAYNGNTAGSTNPSTPATLAVNMRAGTTDTDTSSVTSIYGDQVAAASAPVSDKNLTYAFAATASSITPAAEYKTSISLIATGNY